MTVSRDISHVVTTRVWPKITVTDAGCWEYTGTRGHFGYGRLEAWGKRRRVHRLVWRHCNGPIPDGLWVLHHCDNPPCCNPDHLYLGTPRNNTRDSAHKRRGEKNNRTSLTRGDVDDIRRRYANGEKQAAIGRDYGMHQSSISKIILGRAWAWHS